MSRDEIIAAGQATDQATQIAVIEILRLFTQSDRNYVEHFPALYDAHNALTVEHGPQGAAYLLINMASVAASLLEMYAAETGASTDEILDAVQLSTHPDAQSG